VAALGIKHLGEGGWPLIIWEATTAKRNYNKTNYYIKHVEKLGISYRETNLGGLGKIWGACASHVPDVEPPLLHETRLQLDPF